MNDEMIWRPCSSCKKPIGFLQGYFLCSVSTCNRKRTGVIFCSMPCWSAHNPLMSHRNNWAENAIAPSREEAQAEAEAADRAAERAAARPAVARVYGMPRGSRIPPAEIPPLDLREDGLPQDVLIVVSKLKAYIKARGDMKTSATVNEPLSALIRAACDEAILRAHADGRQTVMDRDFD